MAKLALHCGISDRGIEEKGEDLIGTTRESLFRTGVSVTKELCFAKTKTILEESSNSRTNSKVPPDC
eukprot:scaffold1012_cov212-Ochromonas_danica.AAC.2